MKAQASVGWRRSLAAALVLLAGPALAGLSTLRNSRDAWAPAPLPAGAGGWSGPMAVDAAWRPEFSGPSAVLRGGFTSDAGVVVVDLEYYARQRPGAKMIGYPSSGEGPAGSVVLKSSLREVRSNRGAWTARDLIVRLESGEHWRIWQWYEVGAARTASPIGVKLREGLRGLGSSGGSAAVSLALACADGCRGDREAELLGRFVDAMGEKIALAAAGRKGGT